MQQEEKIFVKIYHFKVSIYHHSDFFISSIHSIHMFNGLNQLGLDKTKWPLYVADVHTNSGRLKCMTCNTPTTHPVVMYGSLGSLGTRMHASLVLMYI